MSQTRTPSVSVPTAMRRSSRSSEALCTRWPTRRHLNCLPLSASQRRTVLSADPLTTHRLSREYDTERTTSSCPRKSNSCSPVPTSHTPIVPSAEPVVTHRPLGEKDVQRILPRFADKPRSSSPPSARRKRIGPSQDPLRIETHQVCRQCLRRRLRALANTIFAAPSPRPKRELFCRKRRSRFVGHPGNTTRHPQCTHAR